MCFPVLLKILSFHVWDAPMWHAEPMTSKTQEPTVARWMLARELRRLRGDRSAAQVAKALRSQPSSLGRWESGGPDGQVPGVARLEKLLEVYEADSEEAARLMSLRETARTPGWWQGHDVEKPYGTFIGLEEAAADVSAYEAQLIPGLLQTPDYTRAIVRAGHAPMRAPVEDISDRVAVRVKRQESWLSRRTPHMWAIIGEAAPRTLVGGADVMRNQLEHLLKLAEQQDVLTLQILPYATGAHAAMELPAFTILEVADVGLSSVYLEGPTMDIFMDDPKDVITYQRVFEHLRKSALNSSDSQALITEILEGLPS